MDWDEFTPPGPPPEDLDEFVKWLETVEQGQLRRLVADAYWHRQIEHTEIRRFFLLSKKNVDMRDRPASTTKPTRARRPRASPVRTNTSE